MVWRRKRSYHVFEWKHADGERKKYASQKRSHFQRVIQMPYSVQLIVKHREANSALFILYFYTIPKRNAWFILIIDIGRDSRGTPVYSRSLLPLTGVNGSRLHKALAPTKYSYVTLDTYILTSLITRSGGGVVGLHLCKLVLANVCTVCTSVCTVYKGQYVEKNCCFFQLWGKGLKRKNKVLLYAEHTAYSSCRPCEWFWKKCKPADERTVPRARMYSSRALVSRKCVDLIQLRLTRVTYNHDRNM